MQHDKQQQQQLQQQQWTGIKLVEPVDDGATYQLLNGN